MLHRILLVEDNALLARPVLRLLSRAGYEVQHAETCAEARRAKGSFSVGLLDIELPDGRGTDLCGELLARGTIGCVVFFTGVMDESLLARARRLGAVVGKTEGGDFLLAAIRGVLADRPRQAAGGEDDTPPPSSRRGRISG